MHSISIRLKYFLFSLFSCLFPANQQCLLFPPSKMSFFYYLLKSLCLFVQFRVKCSNNKNITHYFLHNLPNMRELLNLNGFLRVIKDMNENPLKVLQFILFYCLYQVYTLILVFRHIVFLVLCKDEEEWINQDVFVYYFAVKTMQSKRLVVLCSISLMLYGFVVVHYTFFYLYKFEHVGVNDLLGLVEYFPSS